MPGLSTVPGCTVSKQHSPCARHCASDFMDCLPTPLTPPQIIVKREDKNTKLVVRESFGNTEEGGTGGWECSEGMLEETTMVLFKLHAPQQGAGELGILSAFIPCHHDH